jgi:uncharacterized protein
MGRCWRRIRGRAGIAAREPDLQRVWGERIPAAAGPARQSRDLGSITMAATLAMALFAPAVASGQDTQPESSYPPRVGYVNDLAGVVDQDSRNAMEDIASEVRRKSKGDIVVVTLPRLEGKPLEEIADELTKLWNVGYRGAPDDPANDTGVLIMLSLEEREFSIQVQEGVEAFFPSAAIRDLVTSKVVGPFRAGEYGPGLLEAVRGIGQVFAQRFQFVLENGE